jgi:Fe2+ transport system protein FeoA
MGNLVEESNRSQNNMNTLTQKIIKGITNQTLADMKENVDVKIVDFIDMNTSIKKHLHAYGLTNGRIVRVISNRPEMIIQIEETELALEHSVARKILVHPVD